MLAAAAGCYNPSPPSGVPCGDNDVCPSGQLCVAGICAGSASDAAVPDVTLIDAPAGCESWQAKHFDACALPAPLGDLHLTVTQSGYNWDTGNGVLRAKAGVIIPVATKILTQTNGPDVLVASINELTIDQGATLTIAGTRPLLLAVWGSATIAGDLDGAANLASPGPGGASATTVACPGTSTGDTGAGGTPAEGGGGGGYQGTGGRGGNNGALPGDPLAPTLVIHGGCSGGTGGAGTGAAGNRGAGGGALQITARMSITVTSDSTFNFGGGGGIGGHTAYGAGGAGGAGGYIGFDAPTVTLAGVLAANGGAGGGGASDVGDGSTGPNARADANAAIGGAGATATNIGACGRGGNGSAGGTLNGSVGGSSACGGGGGGGAAGYILVWSPQLTVTGTLSPPATGGP